MATLKGNIERGKSVRFFTGTGFMLGEVLHGQPTVFGGVYVVRDTSGKVRSVMASAIRQVWDSSEYKYVDLDRSEFDSRDFFTKD